MREPTAIVEYDIASVKKDIAQKWEPCAKAEKYGLEFGAACYDWRQKLQRTGQTETIESIWKDLGIEEEDGNLWLKVYMRKNGIERLHIEKRKNRSEPPDDFEVLRAIAKKMLNFGFQQLKETDIDPSHLDAAKTWATCRLEEKQIGRNPTR